MYRSYSGTDPYAESYQAIQNLSMNGHLPENGFAPSSDADNEHIELLHRIQSAIPDINRLLDGYRNTHKKLTKREAEMKHIGNQHEQSLVDKKFYIEALQNQMQQTANDSAAEVAQLKGTVNELRLQLGNLEDEKNGLKCDLADQHKSNEELSEAKLQLEGQISEMSGRIQATQKAHEQELVDEKAEREKDLIAQKQELTELFEEIKAEDEKAVAETLQTREKELRSEHEANKEAWEKEKEDMQKSFESRLAEAETTKAELAAKVNAGELESLKKSHDESLATVSKEFNEKIAALETRLSLKDSELARTKGEKTRLEEELASADREKEKLETDRIIIEEQRQRAVVEMRTTIENLSQNCDRMKKTLLSLGEATDLRNTKGDDFL